MDKLNQIFDKSTCPGHNVFFRYKDGEMSKMDHYTFEQHLADCPMCSDFLDGIETFIDQNEFQSVVAPIQKEIQSYTFKKKPASRKLFSITNYAIAASVAVLLTLGIWYFTDNNKLGPTSLAQVEESDNSSQDKAITQTETKTERKKNQSESNKNTPIFNEQSKKTETEHTDLIAYEDEAELAPDGNVPVIGYNSVDSIKYTPRNSTSEKTTKTLIGQNSPHPDEGANKKISTIFPDKNNQQTLNDKNPTGNIKSPSVFNDKVKEQINKSKLVLADSLFRSNQKHKAYLQYRQVDYSYVKTPYHLYTAAQCFYINDDYHPSYFLTEKLLSFSHSEFEQKATLLKSRLLIKTGQLTKAENYLREISGSPLHNAEVNHLLDSIQSLKLKH